MNARDILTLAAQNLWLKKLRTMLTTIGVIIAIATFTAMVSFGVGMQASIKSEFEKIGLMTKIQVYAGTTTDTSTVRLDREMVERLGLLPGVVTAFPFDSFFLNASCNDSTARLEAQGISLAYLNNGSFKEWEAGGPFDSDSAQQVLILDNALEDLGFSEADSAIGEQVVVARKISSLDSAFVRVVTDMPSPLQLYRSVKIDSLRSNDYLRKTVNNAFLQAAGSFARGYFEDRGELRDTLTITGVLNHGDVRSLRLKSLMIPEAIAQRYAASAQLDDPMTLYSSVREGTLPIPGSGLENVSEYNHVTLEMEPMLSHDAVMDSLKSMGLRAFSYEQEFKQMRIFFAIFTTGLGTIGFVALLIAALGIANTMVMSILERQREIGVLKALGADDRDIHLIFLAESGTIGFLGASFGIAFGWLISRVAMGIARAYLARQQVPLMELFALPIWLIAVALLFGIGVSLIAGLYPANRAARIDPVVALRNE